MMMVAKPIFSLLKIVCKTINKNAIKWKTKFFFYQEVSL